MQAKAVSSVAEVEVPLPPEMELTARNAWRAGSAGAPISLSHSRILSRLRSLGLRPQVQMLCQRTPPARQSATRLVRLVFGVQVPVLELWS